MTTEEVLVTSLVQRTLSEHREKSETFWQEAQKIVDRITKTTDRKKSSAWFGYLLCGMEVAKMFSHEQVEYLLEELAARSRGVTYGFEVGALANAGEDEPGDDDEEDDSYDEIDIPASIPANVVLEFACSDCGFAIATLHRKIAYPVGIVPTSLYFEEIPRVAAMQVSLQYHVHCTSWNVDIAELAIWLAPLGVPDTLDEENIALMFSLLLEAGWEYATPEEADWHKKLRRHRKGKRKKKNGD